MPSLEAPVAQLDRASVYGTEGWGFESLQARFFVVSSGYMPNERETSLFVIQEHTLEGDIHWDLMLEDGELLKTWRLDIGPEQVLNQPAKASKIFDHPLRFLTYEGPVNKGKGTVRIVDKGTYKAVNQTGGNLEISLSGCILTGRFRLDTTDSENQQFKKVH